MTSTGSCPSGRAPVYPDGAAVHQQRPGRPEGVNQLLRRRRAETDHVYDDVGTQLGDPVAERPGRVLGLPVNRDPLDRPPFRRRPVRLALAPAQRQDLVSASDQALDKVGADVAGGSDDEDATHFASLARPHPDTGPWQATSSRQDRRRAGAYLRPVARDRFPNIPFVRRMRAS